MFIAPPSFCPPLILSVLAAVYLYARGAGAAGEGCFAIRRECTGVCFRFVLCRGIGERRVQEDKFTFLQPIQNMYHAIIVEADGDWSHFRFAGAGEVNNSLAFNTRDGLQGNEKGILVTVQDDFGPTAHTRPQLGCITLNLDGGVVNFKVGIQPGALGVRQEGNMADLAGEHGSWQGVRRNPDRQADFNFTQSRLLILIPRSWRCPSAGGSSPDVRVPVGLPERFSDTPATARTACGINRHAIYGRGKPAFFDQFFDLFSSACWRLYSDSRVFNSVSAWIRSAAVLMRVRSSDWAVCSTSLVS